MKFSMTGQEKGDLLIQVTAWAGLTVLYQITTFTFSIIFGFSLILHKGTMLFNFSEMLLFFCFRIDLCLDHVTCPKNIHNMKVLFIMLILRRKFVKFQQIRTQSDVRGNRFTVCTEIAIILGTVWFTIHGGHLRYKRYDAHFF